MRALQAGRAASGQLGLPLPRATLRSTCCLSTQAMWGLIVADQVGSAERVIAAGPARVMVAGQAMQARSARVIVNPLGAEASDENAPPPTPHRPMWAVAST